MHPLAIDLAKSNPAKQKMAAVIVDKRGRVLSYGVNSYVSTHPIQAKFGRLTGNPEAIWLHAEVSALVKLRHKPHTMYVARVTKDMRPAMSKPCPACSAAIIEAGVKRVIYYNWDGKEEEIWIATKNRD